MNKYKYFSAFVLSVLISSCASNDPRIVEGGVNPNTGIWENRVMSSYLEMETKYLEDKLVVRIVTTLGDERVPPNHYFTGDLARNGKVRYKDGFTPEVTEIYFINKSDSEILIKPLKIEVFDSGLVEMSGNVISISPNSWEISTKHVRATSVFINSRPVKFHFLLNGKEEKIEGEVIRLSESEVKDKYSTN